MIVGDGWVRSASPYESAYGFSRAVRAGDRILVAGTAPIEPDGSSTAGGASEQARRCFTIVRNCIEALGGGRIVRTRMFIVDAADADAVGEAHAAFCGADAPAATMVVVAQLLRPEWLVEIEAEALAVGGGER